MCWWIHNVQFYIHHAPGRKEHREINLKIRKHVQLMAAKTKNVKDSHGRAAKEFVILGFRVAVAEAGFDRSNEAEIFDILEKLDDLLHGRSSDGILRST